MTVFTDQAETLVMPRSNSQNEIVTLKLKIRLSVATQNRTQYEDTTPDKATSKK